MPKKKPRKRKTSPPPARLRAKNPARLPQARTVTCLHCRYEYPVEEERCSICGYPWPWLEEKGS